MPFLIISCYRLLWKLSAGLDFLEQHVLFTWSSLVSFRSGLNMLYCYCFYYDFCASLDYDFCLGSWPSCLVHFSWRFLNTTVSSIPKCIFIPSSLHSAKYIFHQRSSAAYRPVCSEFRFCSRVVVVRRSTRFVYVSNLLYNKVWNKTFTGSHLDFEARLLIWFLVHLIFHP